MNVSFYNFSKKSNSTAQPPASALIATLACNLKDGCTVTSPQIRVAWAANNMLPTYAYIPDWGRYYFVRDIEYAGSALIFRLEVDPLASYKAQIGASTQYVLRSAAASNGKIIDSFYTTKTEPDHSYISAETGMVANVAGVEGCFSVGVIGASPNNATPFGVQYYLMSPSAYREFINWLNTSTTAQLFASDMATALQVLVEDVAQAITRIQDYIVNSVWLPVPASGVGVNQIYLGYYGHTMTSTVYQAIRQELPLSWSFNVPAHPDTASRGEWVNSSAYTQHDLYLPGVGCVSVSADDIGDGGTINVSGSLSCVDGSIAYNVNTYVTGQTVGRRAGTYNGQVGVRVPMSTSMTDVLSGGVSAAVAAENLMAGNFLGAAQGIMSAAQSFIPTTRTIGGASGMHAAFGPSLYVSTLCSRFWRPVDEDNTNHGRPLCARRQISGLPGYIQTSGAALALAATDSERNAVTAQMDAGFFYE